MSYSTRASHKAGSTQSGKMQQVLEQTDFSHLAAIIAEAFLETQKIGFATGSSMPSQRIERIMEQFSSCLLESLSDCKKKDAETFLKQQVYPVIKEHLLKFIQYDEAWLVRYITHALKAMTSVDCLRGYKSPLLSLITVARPIDPDGVLQKQVNNWAKQQGAAVAFANIFQDEMQWHASIRGQAKKLRASYGVEGYSHPFCLLTPLAEADRLTALCFGPFILSAILLLFTMAISFLRHGAYPSTSSIILEMILSLVTSFLGLYNFLPQDKSYFEFCYMLDSFKESLLECIQEDLEGGLQQRLQTFELLSQSSQTQNIAASATSISSAMPASSASPLPPFSTIASGPTLTSPNLRKYYPRSNNIDLAVSQPLRESSVSPQKTVIFWGLVNKSGASQNICYQTGEFDPIVLRLWKYPDETHFLYFDKEILRQTLFRSEEESLLEIFYRYAVGGRVTSRSGEYCVIDCRAQVFSDGGSYVYKIKPRETDKRLCFVAGPTVTVAGKARVLFMPAKIIRDPD